MEIWTNIYIIVIFKSNSGQVITNWLHQQEFSLLQNAEYNIGPCLGSLFREVAIIVALV